MFPSQASHLRLLFESPSKWSKMTLPLFLPVLQRGRIFPYGVSLFKCRLGMRSVQAVALQPAYLCHQNSTPPTRTEHLLRCCPEGREAWTSLEHVQTFITLHWRSRLPIPLLQFRDAAYRSRKEKAWVATACWIHPAISQAECGLQSLTRKGRCHQAQSVVSTC